MARKDISKQRFGHLVALSFSGKDSTGKSQWLCQCDCGKQSVATMLNLVTGTTKSCGCLRKAPSKKRLQLTNKRFGLLTAKSPAGGKAWECVCDCGSITTVATVHLTRMHTRSCGCMGMAATPEQSDTYRARNELTRNGWVAKVRQDAHRTCDACGTTEKLHAHHIFPFAQYPAMRADPENGSLLCHQCHWAVHRFIKAGMNPGRALAEQIAAMNPDVAPWVHSIFEGGAEDLRKVIHYAQLALELQYGVKPSDDLDDMVRAGLGGSE